MQRGLLILVVTERLWGKVNAAGQPYTGRPAGTSAQQGRWEADGLTEGGQHILPHCGKCILARV